MANATPPEMNRKPWVRRNVDWRPIWFAVAGVVAFFIGMLILAIGQAYAVSGWYLPATLFFWALCPIFLFAAPGVLMVLHRPSPDVLLAIPHYRRYIHPRLAGLAMIWCGLIFAAEFPGLEYLPGLDFGTDPWALDLLMAVALAIGLVATIPIIAINIFDRRR